MPEAGFFLMQDGRIIPHDKDGCGPDFITVEVPDGEIVMEMHVHHDGYDPRPSVPDREIADAHHFDVYTGSSHGLYAYRWRTRQIEFLAKDLDWLKQ